MPTNDDAVRALVRMFERSRADIDKRLLKLVAQIEAGGRGAYTVRYLSGVRKNIEASLNQLRRGSKKWAADNIPAFYLSGRESALDELGQGIGTLQAGAGALHTQTLAILARQTVTRLDGAIAVVGRRVDDFLRALQLESIRGAVMGSETVMQSASRVKQGMMRQGMTSFVDARGRSWDLDTYAEMAARTVTMEASNAGHWNEFVTHGEDLIQISSHPGTCEKCAPWEGKILSITGATEGYQTVAEAKSKGLWHPRCRHSFALWLGEE